MYVALYVVEFQSIGPFRSHHSGVVVVVENLLRNASLRYTTSPSKKSVFLVVTTLSLVVRIHILKNQEITRISFRPAFRPRTGIIRLDLEFQSNKSSSNHLSAGRVLYILSRTWCCNPEEAGLTLLREMTHVCWSCYIAISWVACSGGARIPRIYASSQVCSRNIVCSESIRRRVNMAGNLYFRFHTRHKGQDALSRV